MKIFNLIKKKFKKFDILITYIFVVALAGIATYASSYVVKQLDVARQISASPSASPKIEIASLNPDYDAIKGANPDLKIKVISFTSECPADGCVNDSSAIEDFDGIKKEYSVKGIISRGYLYIEAAVDYSRPLTNYDDFYFTLNYLGGHLVSNESLLPVPPSAISRYLYDLRNVNYRLGKGIKSINFLSVVQRTSKFNIHTSVSSSRPGRVLKEVSIYYQCEVNSECLIEEIK